MLNIYLKYLWNIYLTWFTNQIYYYSGLWTELNHFHLAVKRLFFCLFFVILLFSPCTVEPDGQWEMAEENENEKHEKKRKRVVIVWGLHSPCTLQTGLDVGSTIAGRPGSWWGKKRGRMEMCLWEGFVCQWALAWTDWKSLFFSLSQSHSFLFQLSLILSLLWPIWCQGTWGCCHSKILFSKALCSHDSKLCPPVWLSECMCVRKRVYSVFLLSCPQFCVCLCLSGFTVLRINSTIHLEG